MIPIKQIEFGPEKGNCFQSCVASILEIPIEDVPNFCVSYSKDEWYMKFKEWIENKYNMSIVCFLLSDDNEWLSLIKGYSIVSGKSPRGDFNHAVIYWNGKPVHDPHPDNAFLKNTEDAILFTYADPSKEKEKENPYKYMGIATESIERENDNG